MNFQIYYTSRGKEKKVRIDASSCEDAIQHFQALHPRARIVRIVDISHLVRNLGLHCY